MASLGAWGNRRMQLPARWAAWGVWGHVLAPSAAIDSTMHACLSTRFLATRSGQSRATNTRYASSSSVRPHIMPMRVCFETNDWLDHDDVTMLAASEANCAQQIVRSGCGAASTTHSQSHSVTAVRLARPTGARAGHPLHRVRPGFGSRTHGSAVTLLRLVDEARISAREVDNQKAMDVLISVHGWHPTRSIHESAAHSIVSPQSLQGTHSLHTTAAPARLASP